MNVILVVIGLFLVLLFGTFLAMFATGQLTRRPSYLRVISPENQTFPNGRETLGFAIDYANNAPEDDFTSVNLSDCAETENIENASLSMPKRARLASVMAMYDNGSATISPRFFWPGELQLPDMTSDDTPNKKITSVVLTFDIPGDPVGISRKFNLQ